VDFDLGTRTVVGATTGSLSVLDATTAQSLSVENGQLSGTHFVYLLTVEFIQIVNGVEYAINNGAHNAAKILGTSKTI